MTFVNDKNSSNSDFGMFGDILPMIVYQKRIIGLDLKKTTDPALTDTVQIYLQANKPQNSQDFFIWEIYGVHAQKNDPKLIIGSNLLFCSDKYFSLQTDKNIFDQKIFHWSIDDCYKTKYGFKNAIGLVIYHLELLRDEEGPTLYIELETLDALMSRLIIRSAIDLSDETFHLSISYD